MSPPSASPRPTLVSRLSEILDGYDAILCDVWGVIHNGRESYSAACEALSRAQSERGIPVVLVSNSPRPAEDVKPQLHALMVPDHAWAGFVTSGDATQAELRRRAPGPVWTIGPARDEPLYKGLDLVRGTVETAAFISATGLFDDEQETPEDYRAALTVAAGRGLPLVCANPDRIVQRGDRMIFCAGALADLYESLGGRTVMAGKPYAPIYELALEEVVRLMGRPVDRRKVLAIGDGLITDVTGAQGQGIDCLFVTDGIHAADVRDADGQISLRRIVTLLQDQGLVAAYATPHLVW
jgi:HAD superfamily hydrolase (TIGR01459 family)